MSDVSAYAPATARQVMFDVKAIRLVSRQPPVALDRYLVTVRPMQSTRRRLRHAVLPSTAGKLNVECSPTLKLGEPGLSEVGDQQLWSALSGR